MKKTSICYLLTILFLQHNVSSQTYGCTDLKANNYNSTATQNDGTCLYADATIAPTKSMALSTSVLETSGLILWEGNIWTHNDNTDLKLYAIDTNNAQIAATYPLAGTFNKDWEEISQDSTYIYIGDFGNNAKGNRKDLKILRIEKSTFKTASQKIDTINFSYANQKDTLPSADNKTDFDCEAFIVSKDSIYLFSKQWLNNQTRLYALPKTPGAYRIYPKDSLNVQGLITGATYLEKQRLIVLTGYSSLVQPFLYVLYDFKGDGYFKANKRKISVSLPFHQVEGICTSNGLKYYITNESLVKTPLINNPQKLHILDLDLFLQDYLNVVPLHETDANISVLNVFYPNPVVDILKVSPDRWPSQYTISNTHGQPILSGQLNNGEDSINLGVLQAGTYMLKLNNQNSILYKTNP